MKIATAQHSTAQHSTALKKRLLIPLLCFFLPYTAAYADLEGIVETVNCNTIKGWAWDPANPATRLKLDIVDTSPTPVKLTTLTAQRYRQDLLDFGKGDGKYGFQFVLPASIRNAKRHTFAVRLKGTATELTGSPQTTQAVCYGKLNDTGIDTCSDADSNGLACPVPGFPGQDGDYGRDAKIPPKTGKGWAGFDFTKIANDGSVLPATAVLGAGPKDWACTRDNVSGLIWEIKTADGGLRDQGNTYSWYNPDTSTNGGFEGYQNLGVCVGGISCDTQGYANNINKQSLCGKSDWRLPRQSELLSIADYSRTDPAIDTGYFPNTGGWFFWSSSPYALVSFDAWFVYFGNGYGGTGNKPSSMAVMLVRGTVI